jgi:hypothetical protein
MDAASIRDKAADLVRAHAARLGMDEMAAGVLASAIEKLEADAPCRAIGAPVYVDDLLQRMVDLVALLALAQEMGDDGQALDEAFIWEPELERRPLVTFRSLREARAIIAATKARAAEARTDG